MFTEKCLSLSAIPLKFQTRKNVTLQLRLKFLKKRKNIHVELSARRKNVQENVCSRTNLALLQLQTI